MQVEVYELKYGSYRLVERTKNDDDVVRYMRDWDELLNEIKFISTYCSINSLKQPTFVFYFKENK